MRAHRKERVDTGSGDVYVWQVLLGQFYRNKLLREQERHRSRQKDTGPFPKTTATSSVREGPEQTQLTRADLVPT